MITAALIRELLQARPFQPFRIHLKNGTHHDITRHDMAIVTRTTVEVGLNLDADGFVEYFAPRALDQISHLEPLPEPVSG